MRSDRSGAVTVINADNMQTVPTIGRSMTDIMKLTPQSTQNSGMAIGGGLYVIGIASTFFVLAGLEILQMVFMGLFMLLKKAHIGEVQAAYWPSEMIETCRAHGIALL